MSVATDAIDRFIQPRRKVTIRRGENDFAIVLQPEDFVVFRKADASALRKVCHFLRREVASDTVPEADDPASW
jgi:hypothetical protein